MRKSGIPVFSVGGVGGFRGRGPRTRPTHAAKAPAPAPLLLVSALGRRFLFFAPTHLKARAQCKKKRKADGLSRPGLVLSLRLSLLFVLCCVVLLLWWPSGLVWMPTAQAGGSWGQARPGRGGQARPRSLAHSNAPRRLARPPFSALFRLACPHAPPAYPPRGYRVLVVGCF